MIKIISSLEWEKGSDLFNFWVIWNKNLRINKINLDINVFNRNFILELK